MASKSIKNGPSKSENGSSITSTKTEIAKKMKAIRASSKNKEKPWFS